MDIGGTKTLIALMDDQGKVVRSTKFPTDELFDNFIDKLINHLKSDFISDDVKGIGLAAPGIINYNSGDGVIFGNLPWHNVPLKSKLVEAFGVPVIVENDANAAAASEANLLDEPASKVIYVTVSTGIGAGVVIDGQLDKDLSNTEPGHMKLEHEGEVKIWESFASGRAIYEKYGQYARDLEDDQAWQDIAYNIALGLNNLTAVLQPDVFIIGGSIGQYFSKYEHHLKSAMEKLNDKMYGLPKIVQAKHPEDAVVYGCYHLLKENERDG